MSNDLPDPSTADTLPELLRRQVACFRPLAPISAVAEVIKVNPRLMYVWCADADKEGARTPRPATLRDVLTRLDATEATIARAMFLWTAAKGAA